MLEPCCIQDLNTWNFSCFAWFMCELGSMKLDFKKLSCCCNHYTCIILVCYWHVCMLCFGNIVAFPLCMQASQIKCIYSAMINQKLQEFKEELKPIGKLLTQATLELYNGVTAFFLPTPAKIHYLFNLRDISKVHLCTSIWTSVVRHINSTTKDCLKCIFIKHLLTKLHLGKNNTYLLGYTFSCLKSLLGDSLHEFIQILMKTLNYLVPLKLKCSVIYLPPLFISCRCFKVY